MPTCYNFSKKLDKYLKVQLWNYMLRLFLSSQKNAKLSSRVAVLLCVPTSNDDNSSCSMYLLGLAIVGLFLFLFLF